MRISGVGKCSSVSINAHLPCCYSFPVVRLRQLWGDLVHLVRIATAAGVDPAGDLVHIVGRIPQEFRAFVQFLAI